MTMLILDTSNNTLASGPFNISLPDVMLTYATSSNSLSSFFIHLSSNISSQRTISSLVFNGIDVTSQVLPASMSLDAYPASVLIQLNLSSPLTHGSLWTVVVTYNEAGSIPTTGGFPNALSKLYSL